MSVNTVLPHAIDSQPAGSNQYFNGGPSMSSPGNTGGMFGSNPPAGGGYFGSSPYAPTSNPYQVPMSGGYPDPGYGASGGPLAPGGPTGPGASHNLGHGIIATGPQFPGLSNDFGNYIMSQIDQGMTPFNLSTPLPSGGTSAPGQLTAGMNPILQQLMSFFQGGSSSAPGNNFMSTVANNGVSALPEWQSMVAAMGQNTAQNQANLAEQFGSMGDLAGSPFGTAMSNYMQQTNLDQNSLLAQLQQSNIQNIQMPAAESLFGAQQQFGSGLQSLDQTAITNMYNEFQRTQPQNNPLMQDAMGLATLFPPTTKTPTTMESINSTIGALSGSGYSSSGGGSSSQIMF